ncbi:MAG: hypothetical protein ABI891_05070, partial [Acidobacteriota bacterium]
MTKLKKKTVAQQMPLFLGIECVGTHTEVIAAYSDGQKVFKFTAGPANLRLLNDGQLEKHFGVIRRAHASLPELNGLT